jgi:hypothetical protein
MFVMFGWVKDAKELDAAVRCYCYRCQRTRSWAAWKETEWVSFFMLKTIPFLSKTHLVCASCREAFSLDARRVRQLGIAAELPRLVDHLEELQLAGESEVQRGFLKAQRQQRETVE